MVSQVELSKFAEMKAEVESLEANIKALRERFIAAWRIDGKDCAEKGRLVLKVSINDEAEKTAWKPVVERFVELHPELAGAVTGIVKANTVVQPYEQVRVVATK